MEKILFINACVRPNSRTLELAKVLLKRLDGELREVSLQELSLPLLDAKGLEKRNRAVETNDFSDPMFDLARQFAEVDRIVIAAPYWDFMFPAVLKAYLENVTVVGMTFFYGEDGRPRSLCCAKVLHYVTTAGGYIGQNDFGFSYVKALAESFFEIKRTERYAAEGLDIFGASVEEIMRKAKSEIASAEIV